MAEYVLSAWVCMKLRKVKPFFVLKNKRTGEIYKDVWIAPKHGFLVLNDNDAMAEIADIGENEDWEWYICEADLGKQVSMKEARA